jgi:hypothetical protein
LQTIQRKIPDFEHPPFQDALDRWFDVRPENGLPGVDAFLLEADALKNFRMIADLSYEPLSVQYGEVGKTLESLYGGVITGKNLEQLYNDWFRKRAYEGYRKMIQERLPVYERRTFSVIVKKLGYYKLHLPFGSGQDVTQAVTYIMPLDGALKRRDDWEEIVKKTPWL